MLSKIFHLSKRGREKVVQPWCLLFKQKHLHAMKQPHTLGENAVKNHCSLMQVGHWWDWEIDMQRTTGFLSVLLELEKCREFCHCILNATRFIWDHSEGRVQSYMAGIVTEMLGCFPRAAPNATAAHRTDSSSGRTEHKALQQILETGLALLIRVVN